jgi:hypothetical protein
MATVSSVLRAAWPQEPGTERIRINVSGTSEAEVEAVIENYAAEYEPRIIEPVQPVVIEPWRSVRGDGDLVYEASVEFIATAKKVSQAA